VILLRAFAFPTFVCNLLCMMLAATAGVPWLFGLAFLGAASSLYGWIMVRAER
jgi:hypothetical protein